MTGGQGRPRTPGRPVYSAGHDPRLRRAPSGRRRPLLRRPDRQPARARPERGDHHGLLRRRRHGPPDGLPARGARLRVEGALAGDRGLQPQLRPGRLPHRRAGPVVGGRRGPARCDPGRRRCRRQAVLAALLLVSAGERPQRVPGRPAGHGRPADPGRHPHRRGHRGRLGGRPDGPAPGRGRAVRLLRRGLDHLPGPARRGLPRLRGRRAAPRRPTGRRRRPVRAPSPGDRPARAAEGLLPARRRRPRRPPALPRRRPGAAARGPSVGHARAGLRRARSPSTRTSRTPGGPTSAGSRTSKAAACRASRTASASRRSTPTSPTSSSARSPA